MSNRSARRELAHKIKHGKKVATEELRYKIDFDAFLQLIKTIPKNRLDQVLLNPLPKDFNHLDKGIIVYNSGYLLKEIDWHILRCIRFSDEVNSFILLRQELEKAILNSEYSECEAILSQMDSTICLSYWGLKVRMLLEELKDGTEANKELLNEYLRSDLTSNIRFFLYYSSIKYETDLSPGKYDSYLKFHLDKYHTYYPKRASDYVKYKLSSLGEIKDFELASVLTQDAALSVIDSYLLVKEVLVHFLSSPTKDVSLEYCRRRIELMVKTISDQTLTRSLLLTSTDDRFGGSISEESLQSIKFLIEEKYSECAEFLSKLFLSQPGRYELYNMFVYAVQAANDNVEKYIPKSSTLRNILNCIYQVYSKDQSYGEKIESVQKFWYMFECFDFHLSLKRIWLNEKILFETQDQKRFFLLSSRYSGIRDLVYLKKTDVLGDTKIDSFFRHRLMIDILVEGKMYKEALIQLDQTRLRVLCGNDIHRDTWLTRNMLICCLELELFSEAADIITSFFFRRGRIFDSLISQRLVDCLVERDGEPIYGNISIPILFSVYNLGSNLVYDALANFLIQNNLQSAIEVTSLQSIDDEKKYYFLHKVCSMENIQDSPYLNSIEKVESERINILNLIKRLKPAIERDANTEIFDITQNATVRECLQNIYDSRIYVETAGIKLLLLGRVSDFFERYLSIVDFTFQDYSLFTFNKGQDNETTSKRYTFITYFDPPISDTEYEIISLLQAEGIEIEKHKNGVDAPYSRFLAFCDIFEIIKREFLFNEDYGLKFFLSMRIRHGSLPNMLKNVFEKNNLVINEGINKEQIIEHWKRKCFEVDAFKSDEFMLLLEAFTADIENITSEGVSWVRIRESDSDAQSMFDFEFTYRELFDLFRNRLGHLNKFDVLIDRTFEALWHRVFSILSDLRVRFNQELLGRYLKRIEALQEEVDVLFKDGDFVYLKDVLVTARTDIQGAIQKSLNWFTITKSKSIGEIPITAIVQTSREYLNIVNADVFKSHIAYNEKIEFTRNIKGDYFVVLCDLFNTILDNVVKHTRNLQSPCCNVFIGNGTNDALVIRVENDCVSNYEPEKIESWNQMMSDKTENYSASFENQSGFPKIKKILTNDLSFRNYLFEASCINNVFAIQIEIRNNELAI